MLRAFMEDWALEIINLYAHTVYNHTTQNHYIIHELFTVHTAKNKNNNNKQTNNVIHILFTLNKQSPTKYQHDEHSLHCKSTSANHHKVCMNTQYKHSKTSHPTSVLTIQKLLTFCNIACYNTRRVEQCRTCDKMWVLAEAGEFSFPRSTFQAYFYFVLLQ